MEVSNGGDAMAVHSALHLVKDLEERERIKKALLEYCRLDTLARVRVLERLKEVYFKNYHFGRYYEHP